MSHPAGPNPATSGVRRLTAVAVRYPVRFTLAATLVLSLLLVLVPDLDLAVSGLFHVEGQGFPAARVAVLEEFRRLGQAVVAGVAVLAVLSLLVPLLASGARFLLPPRAALFLVATLALGPGLLVNTILKDNWGRARPRNVVEFGGDLPFTGPWAMVGHCDSNCSFVSGEASSAIFLLALALVVPAGWRKPVAIGTLLFAAALSANRIAFGGHFLSDVLIAWLLTLLVMLLVHGAVYGPGSRLTDAAIAGALGRTGDALKAFLARRAGAVRRFVALFR
ncbi:phosphatase PAP2 family protein [Chthonobacter rhizosphaerae]|uniref:phosphatase PAP2 family protein n=1 Tax=Chthonobacter rhizosphaerae TaxID=2735553 RepID=UPI0015EF205F|nr:phosphatase PAP2 family protein [Chthonobacter rhizosphaerae]